MLLLDFFRFFQGSVRFTARGRFVERFLNLVARDKIPIWDGRKQGECFTGCTTARCYRRLRRHAKKAGVTLRLSGKEGLPFARRRYRKRVGLAAGLGVFIAFVFFMGQFIWRIEISGNETVAESTVLQALEQMGIRSGVWRRSIDVREAENGSLLLLHDLSWIALNIDGSVLRVEISESTLPPPMVDPNQPCNIVAADEGQIISMNIYAGQAMVQAGDGVAKGEVLVSGITEDRLGQSLFRHAQADIIARVEEDIMVEIPLEQTRLEETGEQKNRGYLNVAGLELPLFLPLPVEGYYRVERQETPWSVFSIPLPVTHHKQIYIMMEEVPVTYTEEEAKQLALQELALIQKARLGDAEILDRSAKGGLSGGKFVINAHYVAAKNIAQEKEILLGE